MDFNTINFKDVKNNTLCLINDAVNNEENKLNRITRAAIPYFNFYGPFNQVSTPLSQCLLIGENLKKSYVSLIDLKKSNNKLSVSNLIKVTQIVVNVAVEISSVVNYPIGIALTTIRDLANDTYEFQQLIKKKTWTKGDIGDYFIKLSTNILYLGTMVIAGPEIQVAYVAIQIIDEIGKSHAEFKKGHYIEFFSNMGLVLIRGYQTTPLLKEIYQKHQQKEKFLQASSEVERRAAIDVGSGGTKVLIADVDTRTNEIVKVVFENSFAVPYQASLDKSADSQFDSSIREQGIKTFQQIKSLLDENQVQKVSAIATEAFRKAKNGAAFAAEVQNVTKIPLRIISQQQEGIVAFNSALAMKKVDSGLAIVWDIGTGSFQMTNINANGDYEVFTGGLGSIPFKNLIIETIQGKDPNETKSPNPITPEEYKSIGRKARWLAKKASRELKAKIKEADISVIGIGRLFYNSVCPLVTDDSTIRRKGLREFIRASLGKADGDLNNPFSSVDVPNAIQVLEVMKALHIHEISAVNTTTTKGLIIGSQADFTIW